MNAPTIARVLFCFLFIEVVDPVRSPRIWPATVTKYSSRNQGNRKAQSACTTFQNTSWQRVWTGRRIFLQFIEHGNCRARTDKQKTCHSEDIVRIGQGCEGIIRSLRQLRFSGERVSEQLGLLRRGECPRAVSSLQGRNGTCRRVTE